MNVDVNDNFGTIQITDGMNLAFESYYSILDKIRPLLQSSEWQSSTTGWYLNVGGGNFDGVRISYFCPRDMDPRRVVEKFLADSSLSLFTNPEAPKHTKIADAYGGEESRFRFYLSTYSHIGLDLISSDLHYAQCLFVTYRWQVFMARGECKSHFSASFESRSPYYRSMSSRSQEEFWPAFSHWPNPPQVDWAHMFLNMILGCDWNQVFGLTYPCPALSIEKINEILRGQHVFQVPFDWKRDGA